MSSSVSSVVKARSHGAVIDGVSFVDCIFRGVRLVQNREWLFSSPSGRGWVRVPDVSG